MKQQESVSNKASSELTWGELKNLIGKVASDGVLIDTFRLKAASNLVYVTLNVNGE